MKRILSLCLAFSLLAAVFSMDNLSYAKTSPELSYSSKKVVKVTKIRKAYEILGWFEGLSDLRCDYEDRFEGSGYSVYAKVQDKRFNNMKEFEKYLKKYLSPAYAKKLLKTGKFVEKNGKLYSFLADRGDDITYLDTKYKITKKTSKSRTIKVVSKYWENYAEVPKKIKKQARYYKQKKINGKWVFTKISLPY